MQNNLSIRMSGLGGQGVVTTAHILSVAVVQEGRFSTVNPFFGAEKRLAPTESYVRISDERIYERGEIVYPNVIMIFHPHVITLGKSYTMPFYSGLRPNGVVIINTEKPLVFSDEDRQSFRNLKAKFFYISATALSFEIAKTELSTNMAMLGAFLGISKIVSFDSIKESLVDRFGSKKKFIASATTAALDDAMKSSFEKTGHLIQVNMEVIEKAAKFVKEYPVDSI